MALLRWIISSGNFDRLTERRLTWINVLVIFFLLPLMIVPGVRVLIDYVALNGEERYGAMDIERAEGLLNHSGDGLAALLTDWAMWDDTYTFAQDLNPEYLKINLPDEVMSSIELDYFILLGQNGVLRLAKCLDSETGTVRQPPMDLAQVFERYPDLARHDSLDSKTSGLALVEGEVVIFVSMPITTSSGEGPAAGTLVFGRILEGDEIANISALSQREVSIHPVDGAQVSGAISPAAVQALQAGEELFLEPLNKAEMEGYTLLTDLNGQPVGVLRVAIPRTLVSLASTAGTLYSLAILFITVALFAVVQPLTIGFLRSRRAERESLERFMAVVQQSSEAILLVQQDGMVIDANNASTRLLDVTENEALSNPLSELLLSNPPVDDSMLKEIAASGMTSELSCARRNGTSLAVEISASQIKHQDQSVYSILIRDISGRKEFENALRVSEERYSLATRGSNDGIWDWNLMANKIYLSERWKEMIGCDGDLSDHPEEWIDRIHPDDRVSFHTKLSEHLSSRTGYFSCEHRLRHADGRYIWALARGVAVWTEAGYAHRIAGSLTEIEGRKQIESRLRYDALHDHLTGLANRALLIEHLNHINERKKRRPDLLFALFFLDLDRFKQINDTYGHQAGDMVLIEVANRLNCGLRTSDTLARIGGPETVARIAGDEFVFLLEDLTSPEDAVRVGQRLLNRLSEPLLLGDTELRLTGSIGVVVPEYAYNDAEEVVRDADIAMYQAKKAGGSSVVQFSQQMYEETIARAQIEKDLRLAVERQEFQVYYQPIYASPSDRLIGFEALVRWEHPRQGLMMPGVFIDVAEETGLIVPMGYFVLSDAFHQMQDWKTRGIVPEDTMISVNLSVSQITQPDFIARLSAIQQETGFDLSTLWLEVTESMLIHNVDAVRATLEAARAMGARVKIDDFGTGYSSLSYLRNLPVDGFKIDRSFINNMDESSQQIVRTLIKLGHDLGYTEVAEGVETVPQKEFLESLSCDYIQGYLMSRPMSAERIEVALTTAA